MHQQPININVTEPYYKPNDHAVFIKDNGILSIFYWACEHEVYGDECIHCALNLEGQDND